MSNFIFKAKNTSGDIVTGSVVAGNTIEAEQILAKKNMVLIDIDQPNKSDYLSFLKRFSLRDKLMFTRQMSTMIKAGVSIPKAISVIVTQTKNEYIKGVYLKLIDDLEKGEKFSTALSRFPNVFPQVMISVVRSGEQTGNMEQVLDQLSKQFENENYLVTRIRNAMIYPVVILCVMVIIGVGMMVYIIPKFKEIFQASNIELPILTKMLISVSDSLISWWYFYLIAIIALVLVIRAFAISDYGKYFLDDIKLKIPIANKIFEGVYMSRLTQTLAMMSKSGVPILETLKIVASVINNEVYAAAIIFSATQVEKGLPLSVPLSKSNIFPMLLSQMVAVGEQTGRSEEVLETLSNYYIEETDQKIKGLSSIIEPVLMVFIGIAVAFIVFAVITPVYTIAQAN